MKPPPFSVSGIVALGLLLASGAGATTVVPLSLEQLAARADVVIRGTVESSASAWAPGGRLITTTSRVRVREALKGAPGPAVEVRIPGGTVGELTQHVAGAPRLRAGEEVVLLLNRLPGPDAGLYVIAGFSQGRFSLQADPAGREVAVRPAGPSVLDGGRVLPPVPFEPMDAPSFFRRLRQALGQSVPH